MPALAAGLLAPLALSYLAGSFPSALVIGRLLHGLDLRERGSGNVGATNALRTLGPLPAALTLLADAAKAIAAVALAPLAGAFACSAIGSPEPLSRAWLAALCAAAAILGHVLPIFAGFRGGKGVAVAAAALGYLFPAVLPWCLLAFGLGLSLTGYASVASMAAALCLPLAAFLSGLTPPWRMPSPLGVLVVVAPLFIILLHRDNIGRLAAGTERRFPRAMVWKRLIRALHKRRGGSSIS
jgi:glycerol-3-phosphate acyltransferase PlsY